MISLAASSASKRVAELGQHLRQGAVVLEGGQQHRPAVPAAGVEAAGGDVPAGELRGRGGLPRPGQRVQQHHPVGVERPVQRQAGSRPGRRTRHPGGAAAESPCQRRSGSPGCSGGVSTTTGSVTPRGPLRPGSGVNRVSGAVSNTTGTGQSCNPTGGARSGAAGRRPDARAASLTASPSAGPAATRHTGRPRTGLR